MWWHLINPYFTLSNIPHTGKITKRTTLDVTETGIQVVGELILKVYSVEN
jgi:hypothetical protein